MLGIPWYLVVDARNTREDIQNKLKSFIIQIDKKKTVIFYFDEDTISLTKAKGTKYALLLCNSLPPAN
ncbi:hypothetical protein RIR_jg22425.t1 [Rhizophagus irregularis DAOM 181602=DAOM 197198]|nr:hypothetical protein RIR_jg22425.t1 [Rhizophagus irregularis DAOM 181602=DAOM 197198]